MSQICIMVDIPTCVDVPTDRTNLRYLLILRGLIRSNAYGKEDL